MRFIVPVPSIYARPNRKYFASKRGVTWLNMVNDQGSGLAAKVVSGTPGESLHMIDVIFSQDGGQRPDMIVADTGTYSDFVFGLAQLLGIEYRPELADMPDQRSWRIDPAADYGPLNTAARGRIDLDRVRPVGGHPAHRRVDLHRHRPRLRRRADAATRGQPDAAG
jgi:TnpA family transposase